MASSFLNPFYFFLVLMLLSFSAKAQTHKNISLGSSLSALHNDNSSWVSSSGEFAFGFQQIENDGFLLAIWFNKIPEKTVVWSAKRNVLAQGGSKLELTADGQLVLYDPKKTKIWSAQLTDTGVAYAAMLDTGNFVLATKDSVDIWGSFDQPTDTLLPTQIMNQDSKLVARYLGTNYSTGRFQFMLQTDGNLFLYTNKYPLDTINFAYWSPESNGVNYRLIFNQSGYLYLEAKNGSIYNTLFSDAVSSEDFYQRVTLDSDGVFRHYRYPKSSAGKRDMVWTALSAIPENICTSIRENTGSGACGYNSYCVMRNDKKPSCLCPNGYTFIDPNDVRMGCIPNFVQQSCVDKSKEVDAFDFNVLTDTDWPLSDYADFGSVSEDWCKKDCLSDCLCAVAIFNKADGTCWKKKLPLSNGLMDSSVERKAFLKVRKDNSTSLYGSRKKDQSTLILVGSVLLGSSTFVNVLFLILTAVYFFRTSGKRTKMVQPKNGMESSLMQSFTYSQLEDATSGFKEELGRGNFGTVYKGVLEFENAELIAVKKLAKMIEEGEQEFKTEVSAIGRTNHKNLMKLLGFCNEGPHRLLVYEYMSNGSLADFLFGESRANWYKRVHICFGIASGLQYLHEECSNQIIHCDIKPQNILLDDYHTARISDFGLAKLLKTDQTRTKTAIRGTKGYVAPEWFRDMPITSKVDVYSFGILLLEIICCRKHLVMDAKEENQMILADWVCDCYNDCSLDLLVENDLEAADDMKRVKKFAMIAMWCIQENPSLRPTMKKVTQMMEGSVEVAPPPDPSSFISSIQAS